MKYFLDTNTIIYSIKGTFDSIPKYFEKIPSQCIVIPSIVAAEIEYGARKSLDYEKTMITYGKFINTFEIVPFGAFAVKEYGRIRSELEKKGTPIGPNDLMIAAIVSAEGGTLVTHNIKEFQRIDGLNIEDWTL